MSKPKVYVIGVGMTPFTRPGSSGKDYPELVKDAVTDALNDAGLQYKDVQQAAVGYLVGGTCCAQRALYEIGFTGIPIYNVNNACASGSTSLFLAKQIIESGNADVFLAAGFEKMAAGNLDKLLAPIPDGRAFSTDNHMKVIERTFGLTNSPSACQMFGAAGLEHMKKYGTKREHFAKIGWKNHLHSVNNPKSQFQQKYTLDQVLKSREIYKGLGLLECSPTSDGAAAAILVSENWLRRNPHLYPQAVELVGMELATDHQSVFSDSCIKMIGFDMVQAAAQRLFKKTGVAVTDVQVIELHDCFAPNELITYEALGMCPIGKGGEIVDRADNTYGGKWVVNPSGGLISKGHPIGATGVAQCVELCNQLRGRCTTAWRRSFFFVCSVQFSHDFSVYWSSRILWGNTVRLHGCGRWWKQARWRCRSTHSSKPVRLHWSRRSSRVGCYFHLYCSWWRRCGRKIWLFLRGRSSARSSGSHSSWWNFYNDCRWWSPGRNVHDDRCWRSSTGSFDDDCFGWRPSRNLDYDCCWTCSRLHNDCAWWCSGRYLDHDRCWRSCPRSFNNDCRWWGSRRNVYDDRCWWSSRGSFDDDGCGWCPGRNLDHDCCWTCSRFHDDCPWRCSSRSLHDDCRWWSPRRNVYDDRCWRSCPRSFDDDCFGRRPSRNLHYDCCWRSTSWIVDRHRCCGRPGRHFDDDRCGSASWYVDYDCRGRSSRKIHHDCSWPTCRHFHDDRCWTACWQVHHDRCPSRLDHDCCSQVELTQYFDRLHRNKRNTRF